MTEVVIDPRSLPKDMEFVRFQTDDLEWFTGQYIEKEGIFLLDDGQFYSKYSVVKWEKV